MKQESLFKGKPEMPSGKTLKVKATLQVGGVTQSMQKIKLWVLELQAWLSDRALALYTEGPARQKLK
jgi:hypothetical protein